MATAIWKFPLELVQEQTVEMPQGAKVLTVQNQNEVLCLWALVDPAAVKELRIAEIYGAGAHLRLGGAGDYVGTAQTKGGLFVWHVFVTPSLVVEGE